MKKHESLRNERYLHEHFFIGRDRLHLLDTFNWYPNMVGGWAHPHAMDFMTRWEILRLTPAQLAYKLVHGAQATIPEWLAPQQRRK